MKDYQLLLKKKSAVEGQIKRVCENKETSDLVFLQAELEQIEDRLAYLAEAKDELTIWN